MKELLSNYNDNMPVNLSMNDLKDRIFILVYHDVKRENSKNKEGSLSVSLSLFKKHISFIQSNEKYLFLPPCDNFLAWAPSNLRKSLKSKIGIALTFDDCFMDVKRNAFPILEKCGIKGQFFPIVSKIGQENYMDWRDIRELVNSGHQVGSHTLNHPDLSKLKIKELKRELIESKEILEKKLGTDILSLAVPYGKERHFPKEGLKIALSHYSNIYLTEGYQGIKIDKNIGPKVQRTPINNMEMEMYVDTLSGKYPLNLIFSQKIKNLFNSISRKAQI